MKKIVSFLFLSAVLNAPMAFASGNEGVKQASSSALKLLLDGNKQFARKGKVSHLDTMVSVQRRTELATGQKPFAIVVACSDSRVSPELLFDKGLGEIFVVRVAGNIVGPHELGSIEYAVEHLGAKLVMVLGHERCGAVTATYDAHVAGSKVEGNIGSLVASIDPAVTAALAHGASGKRADIIEQCTVENIRHVAGQIETASPIVKETIEKKHVQLVKAYYDLDDGNVKVIE